MEYGPVDVLIVAFGEPKFDGSVLTELRRLADAGTVRLLDAMVVMKTEDGRRVNRDIEDLPAEERKSFGYVETGTKGLFDSEDADTIFEALAPGSAAVALAIEHRWALSLAEKIQGAGAEVALNTRVPGAIVEEALRPMVGAAR